MKLSEGQVGRTSDDITFTPVTSCFTVVVKLRGGEQAGAHLSLMPSSDPDALPSDQVIPALLSEIDGSQIEEVTFGGYGDMWSPAYLGKSQISASGDFNYTQTDVEGLEHGMTAMAKAILTKLKFNDKTHVHYKPAS